MGVISDVFSRSRNNTVIEDDLFEESAAFESLRKMQAICSILALGFATIVAIYVLLHSRAVRRTQTQSYLFKLLLLHISSNIITNFMMALFGTIHLRIGHWRTCAFLGSFPSTTYALSHCFSDLIFLHRSKIVSRNMPQASIVNMAMHIAVIGTYTTVVGTVFIFAMVRGELLPNGVCTHTYPWWGGIIVLVVEVPLGVAFMALFVLPVQAQARFLKDQVAMVESGEKLLFIAKKNLVWGSLSLLSTISYILIVILSAFILQRRGGDSYSISLLDWAFGPFETTCNLIVALKLTNPVWKVQPTRVMPGASHQSVIRSIVLFSKDFATQKGFRSSLRLSS